jgi:hypothetical protein
MEIKLTIHLKAPELVAALTCYGDRVMKAIDDLKAAVTAQSTVIDSAKTLLGGLAAELARISAELAETGANTEALDEITAEVILKTAELAEAVEANTPAA